MPPACWWACIETETHVDAKTSSDWMQIFMSLPSQQCWEASFGFERFHSLNSQHFTLQCDCPPLCIMTLWWTKLGRSQRAEPKPGCFILLNYRDVSAIHVPVVMSQMFFATACFNAFFPKGGASKTVRGAFFFLGDVVERDIDRKTLVEWINNIHNTIWDL